MWWVKKRVKFYFTQKSFFCIGPPPGLLPVLGLLERYMKPALDVALFISSRVGADLGWMSDSYIYTIIPVSFVDPNISHNINCIQIKYFKVFSNLSLIISLKCCLRSKPADSYSFGTQGKSDHPSDLHPSHHNLVILQTC